MKVTQKTKETEFHNWVSGIVGKYDYQAMVFDEPSEYGIENGRVSKLVLRLNRKEVAQYDRGWESDTAPTDPDVNVAVDAIVRHYA